MSSRSNSPKPQQQGGSPPTKKRRFVPPPPVANNIALVSQLRVVHQVVDLAFVYVNLPTNNPKWYCNGTTTIYAVDEAEVPSGNFALHLRRSCRVDQVEVETVARVTTTAVPSPSSKVTMTPLPTSYKHTDPLAHVLVKPPQSFTEDDIRPHQTRLDADAQCSRGATGMTTGLRVASIASNMGELRISFSDPSKARPKIRLRKEGRSTPTMEDPSAPIVEWDVSRDDALKIWRSALTNAPQKDGGQCVANLTQQLDGRSAVAKGKRIELVANHLADATMRKQKTSGVRAIKITVRYTLPVDDADAHLGGIHFHSHPTPHAYTTVGVVGDHEGPRCWLPCPDSAKSSHRSSRQLIVRATAPMRDGLGVVGCGEDFGARFTHLHELCPSHDEASRVLGIHHVARLEEIFKTESATSNSASTPHLIPPEVQSLDTIYATQVWCSNVWTPIPSRSLGFAIGPFAVVEDPEYFSVDDEDDQDDDKMSDEEAEAALQKARKNGEGIRQVYFAPLFARKLIHSKASMRLLPNTSISLSPLTTRQLEIAEQLRNTVINSTVGIPHRALSLMRDLLALPAYRTTSYTQVWIPNATHGGGTSGALHCCPEALVNPFLGGAIMDSRLLPPVGKRLPFHCGGRTLQFLQARCAIRGWITAALPLGGSDDVGHGYLFSLFESFLMSLYERGHGAHGEGGAKGGLYFTKRYALGSGLNSINLDFLPVANIEEGELDIMVGGVVGAVPIEDRNNDQLWRSASNGSESHTSTLDEFCVRQVVISDFVEALERGTDKDRAVPLPSMGWLGSHLSLSFLSSNATSSSDVGCGSVELCHPVGGLVYRAVKCDVFRRAVVGRAGVANMIRLIRAGFIAAHLEDMGERKLKWEWKREKKHKEDSDKKKNEEPKAPLPTIRPPFVVCVDELLKKKGFTHTLFTRAIRILAGPLREPQLRGTLVDVERQVRSISTNKEFLEPEGFPNAYVRGASEPYLRVGVHVETAGTADGGASSKGIQLQVLVEPVIPKGGIAYSGPVTLRVIENGGQLREFVRNLNVGSRADWGPIFLHANPVTSAKKQTAASGAIEGTASTGKEKKEKSGDGSKKVTPKKKSVLGDIDGSLSRSVLHGGGFQAIELVRLTNRTPLLWVRVDPMGFYGGRVSIFQPDACLGEQLFHDGDAGAQVEALRSLAERPLRIQGSVKISMVYDVKVSELPVRLLGDCLRGSPALHTALPHTPAVRAQAALALGQWQNNKAPASKDAVGSETWIGLNTLIQYFNERHSKNGVIIPVKFKRVVIKKNEAEARQQANADGSPNQPQVAAGGDYVYVDSVHEEHERKALVDSAEEIETEEDEEYRVRAAVATAIASVRARDGMTPSRVVKYLEAVLAAGDASMVAELESKEEDDMLKKFSRHAVDPNSEKDLRSKAAASLSYTPSMIVADALLAACTINVSPAIITDPATGKPVQSRAQHPIENLLVASRRWLEWELFRENIRDETDRDVQSGIGGNCYDTIAACAAIAVSSLSILRQCTTDAETIPSSVRKKGKEDTMKAKFYMDIFSERPRRPDVTRAASAQAAACICCAADRLEDQSKPALGLLAALEFLLNGIHAADSSPSLRQTLALLMVDACTGKVCSMQRVGVIGARSDLVGCGARFYCGPLGASQGGDNGSAMVTSVSGATSPAANAVNDGARRGLRLLSRSGHPRDESKDEVVVRVARFATNLWRTINGHTISTDNSTPPRAQAGPCAFDGILRCTLLSLFQWLWPKGCFAVMRVQSWKSHEGTERYKALGADRVMKQTNEEKEAASAEENSFGPIMKVVQLEIDRQLWRGEMSAKTYEYHVQEKRGHTMMKDMGEAIGEPLPPVERDDAFKQGGWVASAAQQRRAAALDGGTAVTKVRLTVKSTGD